MAPKHAAALLIGNIAHAREEWEECGSLVQLRVGYSVQDIISQSLIQTGVQHWFEG